MQKIIKETNIEILKNIILCKVKVIEFKSAIDLKIYYLVKVENLTRNGIQYTYSNLKEAKLKYNNVLKSLKTHIII